ncbi:MAG: energy transducer TonB [Crocinitomicaceae bacterium]|jgi:protein TonB|nr:energy transducer TonB [Crocinitomicaceae bacterium]MBK9590566.1 energy transducer TonB [Crocinitomicaceae bacterium]
MELKKSKEADLESKKIVFMTVGLVMVSAIVLMAFTYTTVTPDEKKELATEKKKVSDELVFEMVEPVEPPPVEQQQAPPPPDLEEIEVVDDEEIVEEINLNLDPEELPPPVEEEKIIDEPIQDFVEVDPAFPGGEAAMIKFIQQNVVYPELSREMGEQGTVYVQFVVNSDGSIQDVVVLKGVSEQLNKEAVRVVKKMPNWSPGEQAGKKVRVRYQIPIKFTIA